MRYERAVCPLPLSTWFNVGSNGWDRSIPPNLDPVTSWSRTRKILCGAVTWCLTRSKTRWTLSAQCMYKVSYTHRSDGFGFLLVGCIDFPSQDFEAYLLLPEGLRGRAIPRFNSKVHRRVLLPPICVPSVCYSRALWSS